MKINIYSIAMFLSFGANSTNHLRKVAILGIQYKHPNGVSAPLGQTACKKIRLIALLSGSPEYHFFSCIIDPARIIQSTNNRSSRNTAKLCKIVGKKALHESFRAFALHRDLAHVRDVEDRGGVSRVVVLGDNAGGILHGKIPAAEIDHFSAELDVS